MTFVIVKEIPDLQSYGVFAESELKEGQVIFQEEPLVSCQFAWNQLCKYKACNHCLRPLETAEESCRRMTNNAALELPFSDCCTVKQDQHVKCPQCQIEYCCAICRDSAYEQYHRTLCVGLDKNHPLVLLEEAWRNVHHPPETASIMLVARMIASIKQSVDPSRLLATFQRMYKTTEHKEQELAHKLLGEKYQSELDMFCSMMRDILYHEEVSQWYNSDGFKSLFALIGMNGQGIGSSSLSVWVKNIESLTIPEGDKKALDTLIDELYDSIEEGVGFQFMNCEGSGLYDLQSACRHSCDPNAEVTFPHNNHTVAVKALRNIDKDEEVTICYLDECNRARSRHSRQKYLRENYLFHCTCKLCLLQTDQDDLTSDESECEMDDD